MKAIHLLGGIFKLFPLTLTLGLALSVGGCSWLVEAAQGHILGKPAPIELLTVTTKLENVVTCVKTPGGTCKTTQDKATQDKATQDQHLTISELRPTWTIAQGPEYGAASQVAARALANPTTTALDEIMSYATGLTTQGTTPTSISRERSRSFAKDLFDATNMGGWTQLAADLKSKRPEIVKKAAPAAAAAADQNVSQAIDAVSFVGAYLSAYFDSGQFVSLTVDPSNLTTSVESELKHKLGLSDDAAKATVNDVIQQVTGEMPGTDGKYHLITAKGDGGFTTRGGDKYAFPTVSVSVTPGAKKLVSVSKVDFSQIGSDVVRVYIEAVGDAWGRLPATAKSTGVTKVPKTDALRAFGQNPNFKEQLDETQFTKVNDWSARAETATAATTGQLIRGLGWISLNNESLAKIIETAVGVAVRKGTEKVVWCVEACGSVSEQSEFAQVQNANIVTIHVSIEK